jgi:hypothetical protein
MEISVVNLHYRFRSPVGTLWIKPQRNSDRFWLGINDERVGSYHSPEAAADDVYTQHTGWRPWDSASGLQKPRDLTEWERVPLHGS